MRQVTNKICSLLVALIILFEGNAALAVAVRDSSVPGRQQVVKMENKMQQRARPTTKAGDQEANRPKPQEKKEQLVLLQQKSREIEKNRQQIAELTRTINARNQAISRLLTRLRYQPERVSAGLVEQLGKIKGRLGSESNAMAATMGEIDGALKMMRHNRGRKDYLSATDNLERIAAVQSNRISALEQTDKTLEQLEKVLESTLK